ncbi:MAG: excinuclease ABC subunit UvrA, partial [Chlamydiia bacterium]|nr:excinuclease ABC subunit UvrA [Chlamydiia bacterium]
VKGIQRLQRIEQRGPGVNTRSLPCTFVGLMTPLRKLFAETRLAKARGYSPGRFSLNKRGGRCEACEGLGQIRIQLDFMPDVVAPCHVCEGRRYNFETLQATWKGRSIADVFALSAEEALELFQAHPEIGDRLRLMTELGLDYLQLGQPFSTLSGGELQRLKLVAELAKTSQLPTLYVLDEPSRGLHPYDVAKLIRILQRLVDAGHSVWVIEHNRDLLLSCDWLVELGPEGGPSGGELIFEGRPTEIARGTTATGKALAIES